MAIWLRAREEFADNRFQLLFIYIDIYEHEAIQKPISENNIGKNNSEERTSATQLSQGCEIRNVASFVRIPFVIICLWTFARY